jgi:dihydropteroate synthase
MTMHERKRYTIQSKSRTFALGERALVMGIVNVTPDSFSDGGAFFDHDRAIQQARKLIADGADLLDVGGESTRPFSESVSVEEELRRVIPLIRTVRSFSDIPISIDTTKAEVARSAIDAGADIINDVSALRFDPEMVAVARDQLVPVVLMHMQGTPRTMQEKPVYASLFSEVLAFLEDRIQFAVANGLPREQLLVDPGIGFGKTQAHNSLIVRHLEFLHLLDRPVLLGASRKRFIGTILERPVEDREVGTAVVNSLALAAGAHIIRVHDVAIQKQVALMCDAMRQVV